MPSAHVDINAKGYADVADEADRADRSPGRDGPSRDERMTEGNTTGTPLSRIAVPLSPGPGARARPVRGVIRFIRPIREIRITLLR